MSLPEALGTERGSRSRTIILATGLQSTKEVGGSPTLVTPFVGAVGSRTLARLGVGAIYPLLRRTETWGLISPHNLVQSYRAMKLLESLSAVAPGTLEAC